MKQRSETRQQTFVGLKETYLFLPTGMSNCYPLTPCINHFLNKFRNSSQEKMFFLEFQACSEYIVKALKSATEKIPQTLIIPKACAFKTFAYLLK